MDANTLSGLFMQRLERMTKAGDTFEHDGFILHAEDVEGNYVSKVSIKVKSEQAK